MRVKFVAINTRHRRHPADRWQLDSGIKHARRNDPEKRPASLHDQLRTAFGLTKAEAQLAALLADGEDLREAAGKLHITYGTARTRLAQIFQKTDTRRQAELVRLLLNTFSAR